MLNLIQIGGSISLWGAVLLLVAIGLLAWGFERYRTRFERMDLLIAVGLATGIIVIVVLPGIIDRIGLVLDLQNRFVVISLLANLALLAVVLYYATLVRSVREDVSELTRMISVEQAPKTDGGRDEIFVIIPAYNEAETIRSVVQSLPEHIRGYEVVPLVVSDGSRDETAQEADYNGALVVEHPINQGQGGALQTGFEIARQNEASIVVTMDGDGQHPAEELEHLILPIIQDKADFVMGSRHVGTDSSGNGLIRRSGIRFFTIAINVLTKSNITDCTNGFRAIRGSELEKLTLTEERFNAPELIIEARKNGLRVEEIPITIAERQAGETKKPRLGYAVGLTRTILTTWIR